MFPVGGVDFHGEGFDKEVGIEKVWNKTVGDEVGI